MFSWITGPRITNVIEELQPDPAYDTTFIEPPDTPAPMFAVKALKNAILGTENDNNAAQRSDIKAKLDTSTTKNTEPFGHSENVFSSSPTKPNGILMTPGTGKKGQKSVSFGAHVVDNEGKRGAQMGRSGIPNDCPGKFPSPWAPASHLLEDNVDQKPQTKLTTALYNARSASQSRSAQRPKAKDDTDVTLNVMEPRSQSGKYWKDQYEAYSERSEREMKRLVSKQQMAKKFAKKKDDETMELASRLKEERKRFQLRERTLETEKKELQERLRQALSESARANTEVAVLKSHIADMKCPPTLSSENKDRKNPFHIYEDASKDSVPPHLRHDGATQPVPLQAKESIIAPSPVILGKPVQATRNPPTGKENSPPKPRHMRRLTIQDEFSREPSSLHSRSQSITVPNSFGKQDSLSTTSSRSRIDMEGHSTLPIKSPLGAHPPSHGPPTSDAKKPFAPVSHSPFKPLPQSSSSPDPWMQFDNSNDSPLPQNKDIDQMALPMFSGPDIPSQRIDTKERTRFHRVEVVKSPGRLADGNSLVSSRERSHISADRKADVRRRLAARREKKGGTS